MGKTSNLGLATFNLGADLDQDYEHYRLNLNGDNDYSNMVLIDNFSIMIPILLATILSDTTGSLNNLSGSITNLSGSVVDINTDILELQSRIAILDSFSGVGQADFNSINQNYSHLLLVGIASVNDTGSALNIVGIDFNGDTTAANYAFSVWEQSGSAFENGGITSQEDFTEITNAGKIGIGIVSGSGGSMLGYGGLFFALIPFYSGSTGFYKNAFGFSSLVGEIDPVASGSYVYASSNQGGYWTNATNITSIRVFGGRKTSTTKYDFLSGTMISLYGFD